HRSNFECRQMQSPSQQFTPTGFQNHQRLATSPICSFHRQHFVEPLRIASQSFQPVSELCSLDPGTIKKTSFFSRNGIWSDLFFSATRGETPDQLGRHVV